MIAAVYALYDPDDLVRACIFEVLVLTKFFFPSAFLGVRSGRISLACQPTPDISTFLENARKCPAAVFLGHFCRYFLLSNDALWRWSGECAHQQTRSNLLCLFIFSLSQSFCPILDCQVLEFSAEKISHLLVLQFLFAPARNSVSASKWRGCLGR